MICIIHLEKLLELSIIESIINHYSNFSYLFFKPNLKHKDTKKSTIKIILLFLIGAILFSPWGTELYTKITFWTISGDNIVSSNPICR